MQRTGERSGGDAARKRAAVEMVSRHGRTLRRTARRYSLCAEDAEDAYQRMLEIVLTKAPVDQSRELIAWAQTVVKHEALAIRRHRERLLGAQRGGGEAQEEPADWVALLPSRGPGPDERVERQEAIARSREALKALKPAELRALTLLAEGYSYAEIGELTGFSYTKINRCLAEGRERFRRLVARSEDGSRCAEMGPLLSAFCDGELGAEQEAALREHLRACVGCRAALRAYRATPGAVAALAPLLPLSGSLLERVRDAFAQLHARIAGRGSAGGPGASGGGAQAASAGGVPGAGVAAVAKVVAVCAGVGGAAGGVAGGVVPSPFDLGAGRAEAPAIERVAPAVRDVATVAVRGPRAAHRHEATVAKRGREREPAPAPPSVTDGETESAAPPAPVEAAAAESAAVEAPPPGNEPSSSPAGAAAGEFGP